jgi:paraquat-inducible protein B
LRKAVDQLEAYCLKAQRTLMHEDTKKSQTLIAALKKDYDDLQARINQLNSTIGRISSNVDSLRVLFTIEDLERENEFQRELEDKLDKADEDVNGEKQDGNLDQSHGSQADLNDSAFPGYPPREADWSLQMRKKVIIKEINDIVNLFNDNSRAVRDSKNKSETEIQNLITNNKAIQKQAGAIDGRLQRAKDFAD